MLSEKYFSMNKSLENSSPVYWMPTLNINIPNFKKEDLIKFCKSKNIHLRPFFYPISSFPMYKKKINKVGTKISKQSVNLPSGYDLKKNDIFYVVKTIKTFINNNL